MLSRHREACATGMTARCRRSNMHPSFPFTLHGCQNPRGLRGVYLYVYWRSFTHDVSTCPACNLGCMVAKIREFACGHFFQDRPLEHTKEVGHILQYHPQWLARPLHVCSNPISSCQAAAGARRRRRRQDSEAFNAMPRLPQSSRATLERVSPYSLYLPVIFHTSASEPECHGVRMH